MVLYLKERGNSTATDYFFVYDKKSQHLLIGKRGDNQRPKNIETYKRVSLRVKTPNDWNEMGLAIFEEATFRGILSLVQANQAQPVPLPVREQPPLSLPPLPVPVVQPKEPSPENVSNSFVGDWSSLLSQYRKIPAPSGGPSAPAPGLNQPQTSSGQYVANKQQQPVLNAPAPVVQPKVPLPEPVSNSFRSWDDLLSQQAKVQAPSGGPSAPPTAPVQPQTSPSQDVTNKQQPVVAGSVSKVPAPAAQPKVPSKIPVLSSFQVGSLTQSQKSQALSKSELSSAKVLDKPKITLGQLGENARLNAQKKIASNQASSSSSSFRAPAPQPPCVAPIASNQSKAIPAAPAKAVGPKASEKNGGCTIL